MGKYITGTGDDANCIYKKKEGKKGAKVGCNRKQIKEYFKGLYEYDGKLAKAELEEIAKAYEIGIQHNAMLGELEEMHSQVKSTYESMTPETHDDMLKEIEKMHNNMRKIYQDVTKLIDTNK
jgi:hypothetical protein